MYCVCICIHVNVCTCMPVCSMCVYDQKGQKKASNPLELKLQAVVSCLTWVLGAEIESSEEWEAWTAEPSLRPHPQKTVHHMPPRPYTSSHRHLDIMTLSYLTSQWLPTRGSLWRQPLGEFPSCSLTSDRAGEGKTQSSVGTAVAMRGSCRPCHSCQFLYGCFHLGLQEPLVIQFIIQINRLLVLCTNENHYLLWKQIYCRTPLGKVSFLSTHEGVQLGKLHLHVIC